MSSNPLNDLSKVYLDQVANVKKAENEADIQRWEDLGGPTPTNYKPTGASAKLSREHNDANVITIGARFTDKNLALKCVNTFIKTNFKGGRHLRRVKKI